MMSRVSPNRWPDSSVRGVVTSALVIASKVVFVESLILVS